MARYAYSGKAQATAANTNIIEVRAAATDRVRLRQLHVSIEAATALNLALFRTTVIGTAGTAVTATKQDNAEGAASASVVTGPTGGTLETTAVRRFFLPAAAGASVMYVFEGDDEIVLPVSGSLMIRNDGAIGPAITWTLETEE